MAVAARNLHHAQEFAKKHNIPRVYGSYEELAKDSDIGGFYHEIPYPGTDLVKTFDLDSCS